MRDNIRLNITVVVLASPNESAVGLDSIGDHIVDEAVLVPKTSLVESLLVILVKDLLENILKATVILLHDGVLGAHVAGVVSLESILETSVGESGNRLVCVVHSHHNAGALELVNFDGGRLTSVS